MSVKWEKLPLAEICTFFTDGDWIERKNQSPEGIRLVQTGNVGVGDFKDRRDKARFISSETFENLKCKEIFEGDCLVSRLPDPVGRSCIIPDTGERMITAVDCTILRFKKSTIIPEFFNYYSQSALYLQDIETYCTGATRKRISRKNLGKLSIPVPTLTEQKRIVTILDEAFAGLETAVANTEKNLANARELFESHLRKVFTGFRNGWKSLKLPEICLEFGRGKSKHRPRNEPSLYGGDYPFIQTGDLHDADHIVKIYKKTYSDKGLAQSKLWPKGTVGIAIVGATIGETAVLGFDACFPDSIIGFNVDSQKADPFFVEYMLQNFKEFVKSQGEGSARHNINLATFKKLDFPVPPVKEQKQVAKVLDEVYSDSKRMQSIYQQKLAALAELKQSLLQKAFSGELTANIDKAVKKVAA